MASLNHRNGKCNNKPKKVGISTGLEPMASRDRCGALPLEL